ncbi:MAG: ROK family protein [Clostridia bacterium]|nr:ROK family protein [Clostridia bacterium]
MKAQNQPIAKENNRRLVVKLILMHSPISRMELAGLTGLSKMTITNIVSELIKNEIVEETGSTGSGVGRKKIYLKIKQNSRFFIGLYIARKQLFSFAADLCGNIFCEKHISLCNETNDSLTRKVLDAVENVEKRVDVQKIMGIGVTCIGPLDSEKGIILSPPDFYDVHDLPLVKEIQKRYAYPVVLRNDMDASALAEKYYGAGRTLNNFIYLGISDGIGAGVISNGLLYKGNKGFSGEIGHTCIDINGRRCSCGNTGCLELYAALPADYVSLEYKERALLLDKSCKYLAAGLITLINLFDPSAVFIGHKLAVDGELAAELLQKEINGRYLASEQRRVEIKPTVFSEKSPMVGAAAICMDEFRAYP